jgi:ornithine decarboxylase
MSRIDAYLARQEPSTPCVVVDLEIVRERCRTLRALLPGAQIYYAVKANPAVPVIAALADLDIGFDLASRGETDRCRELGIAPDRFCFGATGHD